MSAFPQYAKTTSQNVFDVLRENKELDKDFFERGMDFAKAHGGTAFYSSRWGSSTRMVAIKADEKPTTGQWKEHPRGGWLPYKNNPLYKEFESIELRTNQVPGLPSTVESAMDSNFQHRIANPNPFIVDDAVYVGFAFMPVDSGIRNTPDPAEGGWEEIRASEFHLAMETYNDRIGASKD